MPFKPTSSRLVLFALAAALTACTLPHTRIATQPPVVFADPIETTSAIPPRPILSLPLNSLPKIDTYAIAELTSADYEALKAVSEHNKSERQPLLSGISRELPASRSLSLTRVTNPSATSNKSISIAAITVANAEMLRIRLNLQRLPGDTELFIRLKAGDELVHWDIDRSEDTWSPIVFGDTVQIAVRSNRESVDIQVLGVLHLFPLSERGRLVRGNEVFVDGRWTVSTGKLEMGPLVDSSCKADENTRYRNLSNFVRQIESATGLLATVTNLPGGPVVSGFCTGTRLASAKDPQGYYILSANHCFTPGNPPQSNATPAAVASTQVFWDYKTSACSAAGPVQYSSQQLSTLPSSGSATLLGARFQSDAVLFRVSPAAGARVALGWQIGLQFTNDAFVHRVSHPSAFSAGYTLQLIDHIENLAYCEAGGLPRIEYFNSALMEGATAPGSSGSAVVTQNLRVVGQQYGICKMTINGYTWHIHVDGELSQSWPAFGVYLQ